MTRLFKTAALLGAAMLPALPPLLLHAQPPAPEAARSKARAEEKKGGPRAASASDVVEKIKEEGTKRSQVMKTLEQLTDVIGPRLTGSPNLKRANEWTRDAMAKWGMENAHLEAWGPFGRGWSLTRFSAQVVEPQCVPLIAFPKAWSPGTDGPVTAPLVHFDARTDADYAKFKGKLKGAIVLVGNGPVEVAAHFEPPGTRKTDKQLLDLADAPEPAARGLGGPRRGLPAADASKAQAKADTKAQAKADDAAKDQPRAKNQPPSADDRERLMAAMRTRLEQAGRRSKFLTEEGALAVFDASQLGDGGTLFVAQASVPGAAQLPTPGQPDPRRASAWDKDAPRMLPQVTLAREHYNRLLRMLQAGQELKVTLDLAVKFHDDDLMAYNTVAEIPGTDLKDEVVMLGGHLDSWHSGTGATDNAAGVAVAMEAARIIKALDLKPRRTIRVGLWTGEEEGLLGSRAYVLKHFGRAGANMFGAPDAEKKQAEPDSEQTRAFEKFSGYFNLDNGTGKVRGVYLQGNEAVRPIFRRWLAPFRDMGAQTLSISNTGGTDHLSFDGIGLPGFQFIQDNIEYETRTHHSNMDVYDRIQADDMKQAAVIMASFVYNAATADEKLPRKPSPRPAERPSSASSSSSSSGSSSSSESGSSR